MSNKKIGPKQVLTKEFIYKIVLLEVVGFSLILPAQSSTGEIVQLIQSGSTSCLITAPNSQCTQVITFPKPFSSTPLHESAQWSGFDASQNHPEKIVPFLNTYFQSDNSETWTSMPAALTEIYGNANHRSALSLDPGLTYIATFQMTCLTASNTANAILRPMYGNPNTGTFSPLGFTTTALDINIGQTSPCPVSPAPGFIILTSGASGIAPGFFSSGSNEVAIFGLNGGGVGDNPRFNNLFLTISVTSLLTPSICVPRLVNCPSCGIPTNQLTMMAMCATIQYPPVSGFRVNMEWSASSV